jgi:hypothetical protein
MKLFSHQALAAAGKTAALLSLCSAAGLSLAAGEYLSGPSIAKSREAITLDGGSFTPGQALSVVITAPSGNQAIYGAVADAEGKLSYQFTPTETGIYEVRVMSATSKVAARTPLATARLVAQP